MSKCSICGTEQKQIGNFELTIDGQENSPIKIEKYNIQLLTYLKGKHICEDCMDTYHKIYALFQDIDFSCGGKEYYADGRNLERDED